MNTLKPFNKYFDHTLLRADATESEIRALISDAVEYGFAAVCVNGCYVRLAAELLADPGDAGTRSNSAGAGNDSTSQDPKASIADVKIACVVGFPLGAASTEAKLEETRLAVNDGADEIDMVIDLGAAKDGRWDYVEDEIRRIADVCHDLYRIKNPDPTPHDPGSTSPSAVLKVIIETCLLTDEEIVKACHAAKKAGADFVKTSTGFSTGGATTKAVRLMKETVGDDLMVKASGGIRTLSDAKAMIAAGADRLGCSSSVAIMKEYQDTL